MYQGLSIEKLREKIDQENVKPEEIFESINTLCHKYQDEYNSFVTIIDKFKMKTLKKTLISGIPYAFKVLLLLPPL